MKSLKKFFAVILVTIMSAAMLVGCGEPKTSPEESTKIFLNVLLKNDKTNMDKIGLKEEDYTQFRKEFEDGMTQGFTSSGVDEKVLTEEVKTNFKNDILNGLTKLDYKVTLVSNDKKTAKVEVKIKGFDLQKISTDAQTKLQEQYLANPSMTQTEMYQQSFKLIGKGIADGILTQDEKTVTMTLTNENNTWIPGENDIVTLVTAVMQM
jgi:hypothetical protein